MKIFNLIIVFCFILFKVCISQEDSIVMKSDTAEAVEVMPKFQDKDADSFFDFIDENLKYPKAAYKRGIEGTVIIQFMVNNNGDVENVKVTKNADPLLEEEALRVINMSPRWLPGMHKGKPVNVTFTIPVKFKILNKDYLVTISNDTIYGELSGYISVSALNQPVWVKPPSGDKTKYKIKDVKAAKLGNSLYVVRPIRPHKKNCTNLTFMRILVDNGEYQIDQKVTPAGGGSTTDYSTSGNGIITYSSSNSYLFKGNSFVAKVEKNNFRQIIEKYFQDCPRLAREVKYNKALKLDEIEGIYKKFCKN